MQTSSPQIPDSTKNPHRERRDIVDALRAAGVAPQKLMELDQGRALAQWQNRKGEVRYERPRHHALSIYINEGDKARRVVNGRAVSQGFPGAVCLFPAGSQSTWQIDGQFEFFHLYFNDLDIARCAEQTWDCEPDRVELSERYHTQDPVLAQAGQLLALSDWLAPVSPWRWITWPSGCYYRWLVVTRTYSRQLPLLPDNSHCVTADCYRNVFTRSWTGR